MRRRDLLFQFLVASAVLPASSCNFLLPSWRYRYRLAAEVERNGESFRGTSVIEVIRTKKYDSISGTSRGEAVVVDIPGAGTLFLLLSGEPGSVDWPYTMPHYAFQKQLGSVAMVDPELLTKLEHMQGTKVVLEPRYYPMLVTFSDLADPASVKRVEPNDFAASFGSGVRLKRITVEITDDPVTTGIEKRLLWLSAYYAKRFDGQRFGDGTSLANDLSAGAFSTELNP
jgi:hypothetical protein